MKKIILELTQREFDSMISMIEDNAIMVGTADKEFVVPTKNNIKIFNKALSRNNINYKIIS